MAVRKKAKVKLAKPKNQKLRSTKTLYLSRMKTDRHTGYEVFARKDRALSNSGATESYNGESAEFAMCARTFQRVTGLRFPHGQTREVTIIVGPPLKQPKVKKVKAPRVALPDTFYDDEDLF